MGPVNHHPNHAFSLKCVRILSTNNMYFLHTKKSLFYECWGQCFQWDLHTNQTEKNNYFEKNNTRCLHPQNHFFMSVGANVVDGIFTQTKPTKNLFLEASPINTPRAVQITVNQSDQKTDFFFGRLADFVGSCMSKRFSILCRIGTVHFGN